MQCVYIEARDGTQIRQCCMSVPHMYTVLERLYFHILIRSFSVPLWVLFLVFLSYNSVGGMLIIATGLPAVLVLFKESAVEFAVWVILKKANICSRNIANLIMLYDLPPTWDWRNQYQIRELTVTLWDSNSWQSNSTRLRNKSSYINISDVSTGIAGRTMAP